MVESFRREYVKSKRGSLRGMTCPFCRCTQTGVIDSRPVKDRDSKSRMIVRRRRYCLDPKCKLRFTTYETISSMRNLHTKVAQIRARLMEAVTEVDLIMRGDTD
jgi:transcriptional regulator NrdR family protein